MAMNCQEFLEQATQLSDGLSAAAESHRATCADCHSWYAEVQPALALFAVACASPETSHASRAASEDPGTRPSLLPWLDERRSLQRRSDDVTPVVASRADKSRSLESPAVRRMSLRGWGNSIARVVAALVVIALTVSFLQQPSMQPESRGVQATLLDTGATLDSIGLVAACVDAQPMDLHTATVADHLHDLDCCTRCHYSERSGLVAAGNATGLARPSAPHQDLRTLTETQRQRLAQSCLLCHNG